MHGLAIAAGGSVSDAGGQAAGDLANDTDRPERGGPPPIEPEWLSDQADQEEAFLAELGLERPEGTPDDAYLDHVLEKLGRVEAAMEQNANTTRKRIETFVRTQESWLEDENGKLSRRAEFLRSVVASAVVAGYDFGSRKSRSLPFGEFGRRTSPASIEIADMAKAVATARGLGLLVKVKESVDKTELKKAVQVARDGTPMIAGVEIVDPDEHGFAYVPPVEKVFVTARRPS